MQQMGLGNTWRLKVGQKGTHLGLAYIAPRRDGDHGPVHNNTDEGDARPLPIPTPFKLVNIAQEYILTIHGTILKIDDEQSVQPWQVCVSSSRALYFAMAAHNDTQRTRVRLSHLSI